MSSAQVHVFTFKDGLLSAIAHDLKLEVGKLEVTVDEEEEGKERIAATFDARSLRVVCARKSGVDDPSALSAGDKGKIEATLSGSDVLDARRYPEIRFASTKVERKDAGWRVQGDLTLHGVTRSIGFDVRTEGGNRVAEITLHQPDFGITPYRAMLGTLKLLPDVRVRVVMPGKA